MILPLRLVFLFQIKNECSFFLFSRRIVCIMLCFLAFSPFFTDNPHPLPSSRFNQPPLSRSFQKDLIENRIKTLFLDFSKALEPLKVIREIYCGCP